MIAKDKQAHIIVSLALTLMCKPITKSVVPVVMIGAVTEMIDYERCKDAKGCIGDMVANLVGIGIGLLIIKQLTCKN